MLDDTLQALSDPTRRAILSRLAQGEARVTDVAQPFAISLNSVSKHIRVLEQAALVRRRREGREHLIALNPGALDQAAEWIAAQRDLWAWRLGRLDAALNEEEPKPWSPPSPSVSAAASRQVPSGPSTPGWIRPSRAGSCSPRRPGR